MLGKGKACSLCRRRKQRCDAVKPVCGPCVRSRGPINCVYPGNRREVLERRLLELESHIATHSNLSAKHSTTHEGSSSPVSPHPLTPPKAGGKSKSDGIIAFPVLANRRNSRALSPPSVPRPLEDHEMGRWRTHNEVPYNARNHLIDLFIRYRWRHPFEFNISRLLSSLSLTPSHTCDAHPALVSAVLLNGCLYAETGFRQYEPFLVSQFSKSVRNSLANADRLFDCVRALAFFGCYLFNRSRAVEGHYYISGSMSLAFACGLNHIGSLDLDAQGGPTALLGPAGDLIELGDRINMFWSIFNLDRLGSLFAGVPCGPADEKITTTWPCPSEFYEDGRALSQGYGTVRSLYGRDSYLQSANESLVSLRAKAIALFYRASTLLIQSETRDTMDDEFGQEVRVARNLISNFADSLLETRFTQDESLKESEGQKAILVNTFTAIHGAVVQIYDIPIYNDTVDALDRQRCACRRAMSAVKQAVVELGLQHTPLVLGCTLTPVHKFLIGDARRQVDQNHVALIQTDIEMIARVTRRVKRILPSAEGTEATGPGMGRPFAHVPQAEG
ncbi:hypothetical protein BOTBODRAFT_60210 [Botryobasidium botryosum FD-172 SS1]|uniref:Zn(2)-C6 fungal-type domain-containing protein n=1 Tax=Botryobasidium botryosum (strain FD-172 SS1) TaxID=930990 RepID=A0A067LVD1_BOTB1|nr:hypothetical protein BOTBODRAFT_60210 [Botryobasidium botryosum FD-172 SS1]